MQKSKSGQGKCFPIFLPVSRISILWQFFVILFIMADFVVTIMVLCFESYYNVQEIYYYGFDSVIIVVFILDILISLNTCYIKKGIVIYDRKEIMNKYISSVDFWVDLISLIVAILQAAFNREQNYSTIYNFIVFIKVIKIYGFDQNIKRYALKSFNSLLIYQIGKNLVFLCLICYTLGAFFYLIDYNLYQNMTYPMVSPNPNPYWIIGSASYPRIIDQNLWVKVTYCFYFTIVLLSGVAYGDLVPQNPTETLYVTLLLFFPLVIYSYLFNAVYSVISKKRERQRLIKKYLFITTRYLKNLRVKKNLETKLITYLTFMFKKKANNTQFISSLAPSIKKQYLTHNIRAKIDFLVFEQMLDIAPLVNRDRFSDQILGLITQESFPQRYKLILPPDRFKLYYINQGICKRVAIGTPSRLSDDFSRGQYFCYYPFLSGLFNHKLMYQSANFVIVQSINRQDFLQLLKKGQFRDLNQAFFMMRQEIMLYDNQTLDGELCFFCQSSSHLLQNCHHLRPTINYSKVRQKNLSRQFFARYGSLQRRINRKDIKSKKVVLNASPLLIQQQLPAFSSVHVQCSENSLVNEPIVKLWKMGIVRSFNIYYPEYNIEHIMALFEGEDL